MKEVSNVYWNISTEEKSVKRWLCLMMLRMHCLMRGKNQHQNKGTPQQRKEMMKKMKMMKERMMKTMKMIMKGKMELKES
jgi:hypothetical protein